MNKHFEKILVVLLVTIGIILISDKCFANNGYNYATCEEYFDDFWWNYRGAIQFVPSYEVKKNDGYSLKTGENVKRAYINFTRKKDGQDTSIIGGRKYTKKAKNIESDSVYKRSETARDSLNIFTNKTRFWYGWEYF